MPLADTLTDAGVSEREAEVLDLVAEGAANAEIAARLYVSVRTVESHVSSLLRKLGVADRRALARLVTGPAGRRGGRDTTGGDPSGGARPGGGDDYGRPAGDDAEGASTRVGHVRAIPVPLTSFVGRAGEVADLTAAVERHRLVTVTGPGGVGKTRLATVVAAALAAGMRDGVWFVDLVPVSHEAVIATAVCRTLGLRDPKGRTVEDAVVAHLSDKEALLVLDNCEHLVDGAAPFVERVLGRCPGVRILATSQARLMLPFEWVFPVGGLSLPDDDGDGDAVALFVERAGQAGVTDAGTLDPGRIGEICRRLAEHSLLVAAPGPGPGPETRYRVLETIRQYGVERMAEDDAGELERVRGRHLAWARDAVDRLVADADVPLAVAVRSTGFSAWRARFDLAADDARAALKWALPRPDLRAAAHELARLLAAACFTRGLLAECQARYEQAADTAPDRARAYEMLMHAGGAAAIRQVGSESLRLWRAAAEAASAERRADDAAYALARAAELVVRGPGVIAKRPPPGTHDAGHRPEVGRRVRHGLRPHLRRHRHAPPGRPGRRVGAPAGRHRDRQHLVRGAVAPVVRGVAGRGGRARGAGDAAPMAEPSRP